MLTIKGDTASQKAANYTLVLGSPFLLLPFFQKYSAFTLSGFLLLEAAILIKLFGERRVQMLKV
jgi:hypothetical protein